MPDYPGHLLRVRRLADGRTVTIRPVRAEDGPAEERFFARLSQESKRLRFHRAATAPNDDLLHFYTHVDYDRHMAFVCEAPDQDGGHEIVGEARYVAHATGRGAEFGIVVADAWRHTGVAQLLMNALVRAARARGFETLEGLVLRENADMLGFIEALGFEVFTVPEDLRAVRVVGKL